ncbi:MAG: hypothetical protein ACYDGX_10080 [Thermoleophilia bacterium]
MDEFKKIALWAGIEDYSGLWEFLWEINGKFPNLSMREREEVAKKTIVRLLKNDWIKLYRYREPNGELISVKRNEYLEIVNDRKNWEAPEFDGISVRFGTTKMGEKAYHEMFS